MIFREFYSAYYTAVSHILRHAVSGNLTEGDMRALVAEYAFSESAMTILPSLKNGKWPLLTEDFQTPLRHVPIRPLTILEKRWLKAISLDPRIRLFGFSFLELEGIEPLFTPADYHVYDKYGDGDPYEDEGYITRFRLLLMAIRGGYPVELDMRNRRGKRVTMRLLPKKLEYSEKDDKFRVIASGNRQYTTVNLGRMTACRLYYGVLSGMAGEVVKNSESVTLTVTDERKALERVMFHFAHFEKTSRASR